MGITADMAGVDQNGLTPFRSIDLDETEEEVKATGGAIYWARIENLAASLRYVKFYNAPATGVTVGTTVPKYTIPMKANSGETWSIPAGVRFDTGICVAATTGLADNDTGAPGANEVVINLGYA